MLIKIFPALLRRRGCLFIIAAIILIPFTIFILIIGPDLRLEQNLSQKLAEYQMRVQYLEAMYRAKQEDVSILTQYLGLTTANTNTSENNSALSSFNSVLESLSPESKAIIKNLSLSSQHRFSSTALRLPTAYHFLPHLLDDPASLRPAYLLSKGRTGVSIVLGIPTVKRDKQSYLLSTLDNLITNMDDEEANDTLIVVFIGETDLDYVTEIAKSIQTRFPEYCDNGLIEVISPRASFYPNWNKLRITLNDPVERVKWRSKQNLDFAYLMAYSQVKATFYVQLEDDILAKRGYITIMKRFAVAKTAKQDQDPWFVLDFCQLGFIGKMFKSAELIYPIAFFEMFYNDKPVDWLLEHLIYTKVCNWEKDMKHCKFEKAKLWLHYKPSLFQHIGMTSSLRGKVQKLKDRQFGKIPAFYPHKNNPPAQVRTQIMPYKSYSLNKAYTGETYFWGLLPQSGDFLEFIFNQPTVIKKYLFRSGNHEHPSDKFYNTTVEVLPDQLSEESVIWQQYNTTTDGYLIIGSFNAFGMAEGSVDARIGKLRELRLHVHTESENWVILSEMKRIRADKLLIEKKLRAVGIDCTKSEAYPPKIATKSHLQRRRRH